VQTLDTQRRCYQIFERLKTDILDIKCFLPYGSSEGGDRQLRFCGHGFFASALRRCLSVIAPASIGGVLGSTTAAAAAAGEPVS
jgi:hypothetical protein